MPTYDYQCRACGAVTEVIHSMHEDGPSVCERCGGSLRRVLYPTGIIFKGSGFYKTDSRGSSSSNAGGGGSASPEAPAKTTESGAGATSDPGAGSTSESGASSTAASGDGGTSTKSDVAAS